ncbi:MAG: CPBP family intramembrane glutamic endopeptidase [Clostridium sp.]
MKNRQATLSIISIAILGCILMALVEILITPSYSVKSLIKICIFLILPLVICMKNKSISFKSLFTGNKKSIIFALILGIGVYIFILGAYFVLGPYFDFSMVTTSLENNLGINKENFLFIALYITVINSLLEEFFFRGFSFLSLKQVSSRKFAYIFSAIAFAIYHVAIMNNWFTLPLFILLIVSLFIAGLLFNYLNERFNNIYVSWIVHMSANLAINTVGFILFGIIK